MKLHNKTMGYKVREVSELMYGEIRLTALDCSPRCSHSMAVDKNLGEPMVSLDRLVVPQSLFPEIMHEDNILWSTTQDLGR